MDALQKHRTTPTLPESSIVLVGLACTIVGLAFRDPVGLTTLLVAVGIGLSVGGTVYIAVDGPEIVRLSLAFVSLVALPLLAYGSIVRWTGGLLVGTVAVCALYTRISE